MKALSSCFGFRSQRRKSEQESDLEVLVEKAPFHSNRRPKSFRVLVTGQGVSGCVSLIHQKISILAFSIISISDSMARHFPKTQIALKMDATSNRTTPHI